MLLTFFNEVIWCADMSFCDIMDTEVGSCLNLLVSLGDEMTTSSSRSTTLVVSSERVLMLFANVWPDTNNAVANSRCFFINQLFSKYSTMLTDVKANCQNGTIIWSAKKQQVILLHNPNK